MEVALPEPAARAGAKPASLLTVVAGGVRHAIPLGDLREVVRPPMVVPVPLGPPCLLGLINLRGMAVPVMELSRLLGDVPCPTDAGSRVLIDGTGTGFLVDRVDGVTAVEEPDGILDLAAVMRSRSGLDGAVPQKPPPQRPPGGSSDIGFSDDGDSAGDSDALLICIVGGEEYAFWLDAVQEVARFTIDGVLPATVAWRGIDLPLTALRPLLGAPPLPGGQPARARLAVVRLADGSSAGMLVDDCREILRVPAAQRHSVPALLERGEALAVQSICRLNDGNRMVYVLSPERLLQRSASSQPPYSKTQQNRAPAGRWDADDGHLPTGGEGIRFIVYRVGGGRFAAPVTEVLEVLQGEAALTPVPGGPAQVDGVRNLRGQVLPVIDVRQRFGRRGEAAGAGVVLVQHVGGHAGRAGFVVDAVEGLQSVAAQHIAPAPDALASLAPLVQRVLTPPGGGLVPVLALPRLLDAGETANLLALVPPLEGAPVAAQMVRH